MCVVQPHFNLIAPNGVSVLLNVKECLFVGAATKRQRKKNLKKRRTAEKKTVERQTQTIKSSQRNTSFSLFTSSINPTNTILLSAGSSHQNCFSVSVLCSGWLSPGFWERRTDKKHRKQSNKHTIDVSIGYSGDIVSNTNNYLIFVNWRKKTLFLSPNEQQNSIIFFPLYLFFFRWKYKYQTFRCKIKEN